MLFQVLSKRTVCAAATQMGVHSEFITLGVQAMSKARMNPEASLRTTLKSDTQVFYKTVVRQFMTQRLQNV